MSNKLKSEFNYSRKILLTYFVKFFGILTGFGSMMLVIPRLASNPEIYGLYTLCLSLTIFFSYADLGFLGAGQKFAAEAYARKDKDRELRIISFTVFFLTMFMMLCCLVLLLFYFNIHWLIKEIDPDNISIARQMILILIASAPVIILQRLNSLIYSIRVEDYKMQSIDVVANLLKILSIGLFINGGKYDIVGYFLTIQLIGLVSGLITTILGFITYKYSFGVFIRSFHFSKDVFALTRSLAVSTLLSTIAWVLYFEMDSVILSKFYGLKVLALYGLGFTMVSFIRTLYSVLFSPFLSIFNHKVGTGDEEGMYRTFGMLINLVMPLLVMLPLLLNLNMPALIHAWVGDKYTQGITIYRLLIIMISLTGFSLPLGHIIIAKSANRILRLNAVLLPVVFYGLLLIMHPWLAQYNLAVAKLVTIGLSVGLTFILFSKNISNLRPYFSKPLFLVIVSSLFSWLCWYVLNGLLPLSYSKMTEILRLTGMISIPFIIGCAVYYLLQKEMREMMRAKLNMARS